MEQRSPRHDALTKQGWTRQFSASEPRLGDAVEEYTSIGFEVLLEPVDTTAEGCTACIAGNPDYVKVIYTRKTGK